MRWTYTLSVNATVDQIYEAITPQKWMSFYLPNLYRGVEFVHPNWPEPGSHIVLRYGLGRLTIPMRQEVLAHERGRRIEIRERLLGGLWTDRNTIDFQGDAETTRVRVVSDQRCGITAMRWLDALRWVSNVLDLPPAFRRFKALVEESAHQADAVL